VRLVEVSRHFGAPGISRVSAVDQVSLDVPLGQLVLLVGPSGSGKTTLLSLIGGLLAPDHGSVTTMGTPLATLSQAALTTFRLQTVGIVFQGFHLVDALSVRENIELPMSIAGTPRHERRARTEHLARDVGIGHLLERRPAGLSGGEKQRCAVARALANDPPLLLADEPTGSLDARSGEELITLLRQQASTGRAVIVATHDERMLPRADLVVRLAFGRVIGLDRARTHFASPVPGPPA